MTSVRGDTGMWFVPTAEVLPAKRWSFSLSRLEGNDGQGFSNISSFPASFGIGVTRHLELFGSWNIVTRIDRDVRPLFISPDAATGSGGGVLVNYPLMRTTFESARGDLWVGGKWNLMSQADEHAVSTAVRAMLKLPTGDKDAGVSSGKVDTAVDLIVSGEAKHALELSGYGGVLLRGNPEGFDLTNGFRWGAGAALPSRSPIRVTAELYGETYMNKTISAPANFTATDGSVAPLTTHLKSPVYFNLGLTFQASNGFFVGIGGNWNLTMPGRDEASRQFPTESFDAADYQIRLGYHPGARKYVAPPPPPPAPEPAPAPTPAAPANHPPTVHATCDPCSVEVGKVATVHADGRDPDGDTLTYQWRATSGTLTAAATRDTPWTAPMQVGPVPITVTVDDGHGGTASDTTTIDVTKPAVKTYVFEDVHFEFDRYTIRPDALRVLDEAVSALNQDPTLNLTIEGHTCNIGTPEYNLALGQRRAEAVRDYLVGRGISADRLRTVSYGEESPKYDNAREETRRLNRRAELVVRLERGPF